MKMMIKEYIEYVKMEKNDRLFISLDLNDLTINGWNKVAIVYKDSSICREHL